MFLDNNKKFENKFNRNKGEFLFFLIILCVYWLSFIPITGAESEPYKFDTVEIGVKTQDCVLRCIGYNPLFESNGSKNYEVRFRVESKGVVVKCVIPAKEIDELHNIEVDAKYKGKIELAYLKNNLDSLTSTLNENEKEEYISKFLDSNKQCWEISKIDFMYSEYLSNYSFEHAQEVLINRWQK